MTRTAVLAVAVATASAMLGGCGAPQQAGPAPVEVIVINDAPIPSADAPVVRPEFHVINKGETLSGIAYQYGLSHNDLALWNNISNPDVIEVGQRLQLQPPKGLPVVTTVKPVKPQVPVSGTGKEELERASAQVTRTQVGIGSTKRAAPTAEVFEPVALKIPYSDTEAERLLGQAGGGAEQAALVVRATPAAGGPPRNVRERNGINWSWPVNGKLAAKFDDTNKGIDITGPRGQPVYASANGKVIYAGSGLKGYGQLVIIKHANEYLSTYAHNDRIFVAEGEDIERGQPISEMGDTGTDRVSLHFEIRRGTDAFDPQQFLPKNP